jgi:hypothetical protein
MSIEFYPKNSYFLLIENFKTKLGYYVNSNWGDLSIAHMRVFHKNTDPYEYNLRLVISPYEGGPTIHASDWFKFSNDVTGQQSSDWLGDIIFTFPEYPLINSSIIPQGYFISMETEFYTPDGLNNYLGVWCDWMQPVGNTNTAGARIAIGVKR